MCADSIPDTTEETTESTYDANIRMMQSRVWEYWRRIQFGKRMIAKRKAQGLPTKHIELVVYRRLYVEMGAIRCVLSVVGEDVRP